MANRKVTVACKLPNGLELNHGDVSVTFKGSNDANAVCGFGMTHGVDGDWFDDWCLTAGADFAPIQSGALFSQDTPEKAVGEAAEKENDARVLTGQEPIDPDKPGKGIEKVK